MSISKMFSYFILMFLVIVSCDEDEAIDDNQLSCATIEDKINWTRERFNATYTIMFPDLYDGGIQERNGGTTFDKRRNDQVIIVSGGFCDPAAFPCLAADFYGEAIDQITDSLSYKNSLGNWAYLNKKVELCKDEMVIAYFFYNDMDEGTFRNSYGRIYLIDDKDAKFRRAGAISYVSAELLEVIDILESLNKE